MKKVLLGLAAVAAIFGGVARAGDIDVLGTWITIINASHLQAGAGSNLQSNITSIGGVSILSLKGFPKDWVVLARLTPGSSSPHVSLQVRRSSAGIGPGFITGGESFISLSSTNTVIFSGEGSRDGVALQYRLSGMSTDVTPGTYNAPILFTVE
jgi:hypothetical protein